mmetsp:Transcript_31436/g.48058  ORF Transcript_31436/g.48058 Transcript_31436/m.48058 type:complete len:178 (+) Transcript_31436:3255-3788(+)
MVMQNDRFNDMVLKAQFVLLAFLYALAALLSSVFLLPSLFFKSVVNAGYIMFNTKRQKYRGEKIIKFILNLFTSPFVILASMIIDILSVGEFLLRDESQFQFKYRQSEDDFASINPMIAMKNFGRIFYDDFEMKHKGKQLTLIDLMNLHTRAYDLVENLHDLFCRGTKDYKEALANV